MPADFERCVKRGGKVRTIKNKDGSYFHICILKGKTYKGYVKKPNELSKERKLKLARKT